MKEKNFLQFVMLSIFVMTFIATLFQLWEQDIFWQIKAGKEILSTMHLQYKEQWPYTALNTPWFNFQWLATAFLALIYNTLNIEGLIISRAILLTILLIIQVKLIFQSTKKNPLLISVLLIPFFYSSLVMRIQIRPEFFVIILYSLLLILWKTNKEFKFKIAGTLFLIILATNLHPGLAPFLVLSSALMVIATPQSQKIKIFLVSVFIISFFISPYAAHLLTFLQRHIFYQSKTVLPNPEYFPLSLNDFNPLASSLYAYSWVLLTLLAFVGFLRNEFTIYGRRILTLPVFVFLTVLCLKSPRAIPFQVIFSFPIVINIVDQFFASITLRRRFLILLVFFSFTWGCVQIKLDPSPLGLTLFPFDTPKTTINFLREHHPSRNLLHSPGWGNYLLFALEDYPVFFDSREIPFDPIQKSTREMLEQPELMTSFLKTYNVNSILLPMGFFLAPYPNGAIRRAVFFPTSDWAVVSYDEASILLLKRTREHEELIKKFEYKYVVPDLPLNLNLTEAQTEFSRCRNENPDFAFCP